MNIKKENKSELYARERYVMASCFCNMSNADSILYP